MNQQDSLFVLSALAEATNPITGHALSDPVFQRSEIRDALTSAQRALRQIGERKQGRGQRPANAGKPWTSEQDQALAQAFENGKTVPTMAAEQERSVAAIEARLVFQGLLKAEETTTRIRF